MRVVRCSIALILLALQFLAPQAALAQPDPKPIMVQGGGTEVFRALLNYAKIKPVTRREILRLNNPEEVIVIIMGDPSLARVQSVSPSNVANLAISRGGAALIAMDTLFSFHSPSGATFSITGEQVTCTDAESIHEGRPSCPYLIPVDAQSPSPVMNVFRGLRRIATNKPSYLLVDRFEGSFQHVLARFPRGSKDSDRLLLIPPNASFAVGGEGPEQWNRTNYQFLAMADHSVFINQMLLEPGTDNFELAYRTIEFLQGPNKRSRCAFFEDGELIDHFDDLGQAAAKQNPMPIPQINMGAMQEWLVDLGNRFIDDIQSRNLVNRALDSALGIPAIARFFLVIATVLACWFLLRRAWSSRKPNDAPPSPTVAGAPTGPPGVFERRQKELLRRNNVYEPIRDLLRDFFATIGIHGEQGRRHPKIVVSDVVRKPDSLRAAVKDMWKIAFGPPQAMTVSGWRELEPFFERLRTAHADGKWHFVHPESTAGSVE